MIYQLPKKYEVAAEEAARFLERVGALREAYQDDEYREFFNIVPSAERAAVKRASLDLSRALVSMRATTL